MSAVIEVHLLRNIFRGVYTCLLPEKAYRVRLIATDTGLSFVCQPKLIWISRGLPSPPRRQSSEIHIKGLIVSSYSADHSHWNSFQSLGDWLKSHNVPALYGLDTRSLTKRIRQHGAVLGKIELNNQVPACGGTSDFVLMPAVRSQSGGSFLGDARGCRTRIMSWYLHRKGMECDRH